MSTQRGTHTPGPWKFDKYLGNIDQDYGPTICSMVDRREHEFDNYIANARLIAAAPEMLDSLKAMLSTHDRRHATPLWANCEEAANETDPDHINWECVEAMTTRALLARIEGESEGGK